jgi:hypothetical protein
MQVGWVVLVTPHPYHQAKEIMAQQVWARRAAEAAAEQVLPEPQIQIRQAITMVELVVRALRLRFPVPL